MKVKNLIFILLLSPVMLFSQETATDFFTKISNNYANLEAYTANFKFTNVIKDKVVQEQEGVIYYMSPNLLKLEYTNPEEQVLNINSTLMSLYVPSQGTVFEQQINTDEEAEALEVSGLTSQGLSLFKMNYTSSYLNGPDTEALDEENPQEVYKLALYPRKPSVEPFTRIILSITAEGFIRRIESLKKDNELIILDIVDINPDVELTPEIFVYDPPPTATTIRDFLFTYEEEETE